MNLELADFIEMLNSTRQFLFTALAEIPDDQFDSAPAVSTSSTREIIQHIAMWETAYISRIQHDDDRDIDHSISQLSGRTAIMDKLESLRKIHIEVIHKLQQEDLDRPLDHNGIAFNVRKMLMNWIRHETYHIGQIFFIANQLDSESNNRLPKPPRPILRGNVL
jgi:uncharacterized damage-inducible protein DinB